MKRGRSLLRLDVVLRLHFASGSPGGLGKIQMPWYYPIAPDSVHAGWGLEICNSFSFKITFFLPDFIDIVDRQHCGGFQVYDMRIEGGAFLTSSW